MKLGLSPLLLVAAVAACSGRAPSDLLSNAPTPEAAAEQTGNGAPFENDRLGLARGASKRRDAGDATSGSDNADARSGTDASNADADANGADAATLESLYAPLPIAGAGDAPTASALSVQCATSRTELDAEPSDSVYPGAFVRVTGVTDPQGLGDLAFTTQELVLFAALDGSGAEAHTFTVSVLGTSFSGWELGTYFGADAPVLAAMCARAWWPGEITLTDASGHVTRAKVRVPVVH